MNCRNCPIVHEYASDVHMYASGVRMYASGVRMCQWCSHVCQWCSHLCQWCSHLCQWCSHLCQWCSHLCQWCSHLCQWCSHLLIYMLSELRQLLKQREYIVGGGVRGIPVQRSCLLLIFRSLFSLQIISRSLFWEHSPFTVLSNNYSLFTVLR